MKALVFIIRTAGMHRNKAGAFPGLSNAVPAVEEIQKRQRAPLRSHSSIRKVISVCCSLRDYYTSEIEEILVDDVETYRKMREYSKAVSRGP